MREIAEATAQLMIKDGTTAKLTARGAHQTTVDVSPPERSIERPAAHAGQAGERRAGHELKLIRRKTVFRGRGGDGFERAELGGMMLDGIGAGDGRRGGRGVVSDLGTRIGPERLDPGHGGHLGVVHVDHEWVQRKRRHLWVVTAPV